jgi:hypothetical protein
VCSSVIAAVTGGTPDHADTGWTDIRRASSVHLVHTDETLTTDGRDRSATFRAARGPPRTFPLWRGPMTDVMRAHKLLVVLLATVAAFVLATALSTSALVGTPTATAQADDHEAAEGEPDGEPEEGGDLDGTQDGTEDGTQDGTDDGTDGTDDGATEGEDGFEDEDGAEVLDESFEGDEEEEAVPTGGVDAGFGGLATAESSAPIAPIATAATLLAAATAASIAVRRRGLVS